MTGSEQKPSTHRESEKAFNALNARLADMDDKITKIGTDLQKNTTETQRARAETKELKETIEPLVDVLKISKIMRTFALFVGPFIIVGTAAWAMFKFWIKP